MDTTKEPTAKGEATKEVPPLEELRPMPLPKTHDMIRLANRVQDIIYNRFRHLDGIEVKPLGRQDRQIDTQADIRAVLGHVLWLCHHMPAVAENDPIRALNWVGYINGLLEARGIAALEAPCRRGPSR